MISMLPGKSFTWYKNLLIITLFILWAPLQVLAHQDTLLTLASNGEILGLPREYNPAYLQISKGSLFTSSSVKVKLNHNVTNLPSCISKMFLIPPSEKMTLSASWYHDVTHIPPYLGIYLPQKTSPNDTSWFNGYEIILNLQTSEILSIHKRTISGSSMQREPIKIESICKPKEIINMKPKKE